MIRGRPVMLHQDHVIYWKNAERYSFLISVSIVLLHYRPGTVALTDFPAYVERMHKDSDLLFADAYKVSMALILDMYLWTALCFSS